MESVEVRLGCLGVTTCTNCSTGDEAEVGAGVVGTVKKIQISKIVHSIQTNQKYVRAADLYLPFTVSHTSSTVSEGTWLTLTIAIDERGRGSNCDLRSGLKPDSV